MTNVDSFLSGPHQCLDASPGRPFTFTLTVAHRGGGAGSEQGAGKGGQAAPGGAATHVVERGQSLWAIAQSLLGAGARNSRVVSVVARLWRLNAARIGSGDPDLIFPGQTLRLQ
jgi:nucleoid-associated protein YgaU